VLNTLVPRQKLSGEVYAYEGLIQDITDRKQLESKLREGELRYRSIVEGQTAVIFRLKPSGICSFANERFCEVFGKDRADLVGTAWFPQTDPPGANIVSALISEPTIAKPVYEVECRVLDGRSQWRWYEFVSRGLFDENGWMTETQVVGGDITKQKLYEEALHKNQELTQRILQTGPQPCLYLRSGGEAEHLHQPGNGTVPGVFAGTGSQYGIAVSGSSFTPRGQRTGRSTTSGD
jgi:PAS domain S-box-containing protein